jgi:hypothetical protein
MTFHPDTHMDISRKAATAKGPAETFTGEVWIDPITRGLPATTGGSHIRGRRGHPSAATITPLPSQGLPAEARSGLGARYR